MIKKTEKAIPLFFSLLSVFAFAQEKPFFVAPQGQIILSTDLHIHTVFSDGSVWPNIRVEEALREGLDLISITDHLEYQPHRSDLPNPDRNRSFDIAEGTANNSKLTVIRGAEITRSMPPGHLNAVFIQDANKLLFPDDSLAGIVEANRQNGFVFWNHPNWEAQGKDGISRLDQIHLELIERKLLHGIEVVNFSTFSEEAIEIALENKLTMLGTSDIHKLTTWDFNIPQGGHRPMTFVLSKNNSEEEVKKALFEGKTMVWFKELMIGEEEHLSSIVKANLTASTPNYKNDELIAKVTLKNHSANTLHLKYTGPYTFHQDSTIFKIDPYSERTIDIKTLEVKKSIDLPFDLLNGIIGRKKYLNFKIETE
ncbi:MAG: PHP domain-containing protein [Flavobacteriales bacterium TMED235]|nr:MAG: PHP domain-containing protein [Flavobacteriales bacterium TMED235]|tara:strand:+ start:9698 stop:10801 length:1104 start_codon:yes stop_codon:yes gene_type:complete